jgi:hypothetical protein
MIRPKIVLHLFPFIILIILALFGLYYILVEYPDKVYEEKCIKFGGHLVPSHRSGVLCVTLDGKDLFHD